MFDSKNLPKELSDWYAKIDGNNARKRDGVDTRLAGIESMVPYVEPVLAVDPVDSPALDLPDTPDVKMSGILSRIENGDG